MHSEVGIGSQSLPYGLQNEIMYNPCSNGGLGNNRIGCTKFCEERTTHSKEHSEVGIIPQSLPYEFQNEIMDHPCLDGGPRSNRIRCTKFCEWCTKDSKLHFEVGTNHFLMGFKMKSWTIHVRMGVSKAIGSDIPNLMKYIPNFVKDAPNFVKDVPRVLKCVPRWGLWTPHF